MHTVSFIVPCYNLRDFLPETLNSIISQSFCDWECIVVDDGSSDDSASIADAYASRDCRIRVIKQHNGGVVTARNNGVLASTGRYLVFLDADDVIMPGFLSEAVPILDARPEVKLVYGPAEQFGKGVKTALMPMSEFSMEAMLGHNCIYVTALFRKADFLRAGGFREEMSAGLEDWDLWLSVLEDGGEVVCLEHPVFRYRVRKNSRNRGISNETLSRLRRSIWERHKDLYAKYFFDPRESMEYSRSQYYVKKYSSFPGVWLYLKISALFGCKRHG